MERPWGTNYIYGSGQVLVNTLHFRRVTKKGHFFEKVDFVKKNFEKVQKVTFGRASTLGLTIDEGAIPSFMYTLGGY